MNFGPHHYVPVLKVKQNEKFALKRLSPTFQPLIVPLLEIVERKPDNAATIDKHLNTSFNGLADSVQGYPRCFIDTREIAADGPLAAEEVFQRAKAAGIVFTPVTGVYRTADVNAALNNRKHGLAIRLRRHEFESGALPARLVDFLSQHALKAEEIDLIIDLGGVDDLIADGIMALSQKCLSEVPHQQQWRTFTLSACAFPKTMAGISRYSHDLMERADWIAWKDGLHANHSRLLRLPTFSDCAIQHPSGVEGFDFRTMQVSASIRYTLPDHWLLIKGESTKRRPAKEQFPELAAELVYGNHRCFYAGAQHCPGCADIKAAADGASGFGSAGVWRRIGSIHHMTSVMEELYSLPWS